MPFRTDEHESLIVEPGNDLCIGSAGNSLVILGGSLREYLFRGKDLKPIVQFDFSSPFAVGTMLRHLEDILAKMENKGQSPIETHTAF